MKLTVEGLRGAGGFTGAAVKRSISWKHNGEEFDADVFVRQLSYQSAVTDARALSTDGDLAAARIAHCICDDSGKPIFKISDITGIEDDGSPVLHEVDGEMVPRGQLNSELGTALLVAISEVNEMGKPKARKKRVSRKKTSSGTN